MKNLLHAELLYSLTLLANKTINPIPLFEKWGFHNLAIFTPPKVERRKPAAIGKK
jgi:hypothetical protein